jgi:hypothetical protein
MLTFIKIIFIVIAGIFLVSFLQEGDFSLVGSDHTTTNGPADRAAYTRSYDDNNDGTISDSEYRDGEIERIQAEADRLEEEVALALEEENRSPYRDMVEISTSGADATDRNDEYVTIEAASDNPRPIDITGWHLKSLVTGRDARIPKGVRFLQGNRPWLSQTDIYLVAGDTAYVTTGGAAGIGTSFLTNECIGYLDRNDRFTPSLSQSCPQLEDEDLERFDLSFDDFRDEDDYDACMDAIEDVGTCERAVPDRDLTRQCRDFMSSYSNYDGCVKLHKSDTDFLGDEWHIFLNLSRNDLWREEREAIALLDENGLIVDVERY